MSLKIFLDVGFGRLIPPSFQHYFSYFFIKFLKGLFTDRFQLLLLQNIPVV